MWQHNYEPLSGSLGLSAIVAAVPVFVLFLMLGVLRRPAWMSALTALVSAFVVALGVYGMPIKLALISTVYGAAFGIFPIAWIVFAAIMLYRLAVDTGKFEIIKDSVGGLSRDRRLQAMFIAFSFGAFIEGAAGFGAPVAISGAMLAGLGFNPFYAAGICLLANTAPVAFGSIGIPVTTLANITGLPVMSLSAMVGHGAGVGAHSAVAVAPLKHSAAAVFTAWLPYLLLVVFVLVWGEADVKLALNRWTNSLLPTGIPRSPTLLNGLLVPGLHNMIQRVPPVVAQPTPYAAPFEFNWLSASGTSCFLATITAALFLRVSPARVGRIYLATFKQLALPILTIALMLGLAYLMNYSGMTSTLGLALAATGPAFPFFSAVLGWLGVFLTGSDTSANALFGNLQVVTANALHLNPVLTASVNSAAGVMGKMISIQSIAVAVAATGMTTADEGRLFRFTIKHSIFLMALMGVLSLLFAYVFSAYVPSP